MGIFNDNSQNDHLGHIKFAERGPAGPPGVGFELTKSSNYDMDGKRLTDLSRPVDGTDAATKSYVDEKVGHHTITNYHLRQSFTFYDSNNTKLALSTDKITGLLSDYKYGYYKIIKSGDESTYSYVNFKIKNNLSKSTYSALFYLYGYKNNSIMNGLDLGPILFVVDPTNYSVIKYDDDDSIEKRNHTKGIIWFTADGAGRIDIELRFFDKSITHFVVLSRCVEGKVNLGFSIDIFNVPHNNSGTFYFEDINMNNRKITNIGDPVDNGDGTNKKYVDTENAKQDIAIADKANKSYVDGELANLHINSSPLLPRDGSKSMTGDLNMNNNYILYVDNLDDWEIINPLDYSYRIKDLRSTVNKGYLNEYFIKKVDKNGKEYYDLKQNVIKNSAPYDDGSYDDNTLVSKKFMDEEIKKIPKPASDVLKLDGSKAMAGDLDMGNNDIDNLKTVVEDDGANPNYYQIKYKAVNFALLKSTRDYLKRLFDNYLEITDSGALKDDLDMGNHSIINLKEANASDINNAASVNFVNNTIEKKIQESEERSIQSVQQGNIY